MEIFISISIAGGMGSAYVRELGSAAAKNNDPCHSTLSPASDGHRALGLLRTRVVPNSGSRLLKRMSPARCSLIKTNWV